MILEFRHETVYRYADRVFLEPHVVRLIPRQDASQRVVSKNLSVEPQPSGVNEILDAFGNQSWHIWFNHMVEMVSFTASAVVEVTPGNPFDFLVHPAEHQRLPVVYGEKDRLRLAPFLGKSDVDRKVEDYARLTAESVQWNTLNFLLTLSRDIHAGFTYQPRESGAPHPPARVLESRCGSCRDFTVLAMAVCAELGLATRYVSGYYFDPEAEEPPQLHAWFEVYIPGGGWRGYDPTHGIACTHQHLALCAGIMVDDTLPVSGTFRGQSRSHMKYKVDIHSCEAKRESILAK